MEYSKVLWVVKNNYKLFITNCSLVRYTCWWQNVQYYKVLWLTVKYMQRYDKQL